VNSVDDTVTIGGHVVPVSEVSGGMIMAFTMMLVSYAFAFGMPLRNYVRFIIIAASPLLAVALNAVRLIPTVWLYSYAGPATANFFHILMGWLVVALSFMTLFAIIRILRRAMVPVTNFTLATD